MCRIVFLAVVVSLLGPNPPAAPRQAAANQGAGNAAAVLAAAREALGGEAKLAAVRTFVATGRTRQVRGNNLVPIEFEIACELPDKYVRRDEIPAQESGPTSSGFNGDVLIQLPLPPEAGRVPAPAAARTSAPAGATAGSPASNAAAGPGTAPSPPADPRAARVTSLKQDFARLTLGMFATSFSSVPLAFTAGGRAEAPQGSADIVDVRGPGTFALKLFISSQTHLPIMVSWTMPATNVVVVAPGQPRPDNLPPGSVVVEGPALPGPAATKEEQAAYAKELQAIRAKAMATAKPVEYRLYYADYRDVGGGVRFPFRLRRAVAGETVEETNFDAFRLNARIDPRRFQGLAAPPKPPAGDVSTGHGSARERRFQ